MCKSLTDTGQYQAEMLPSCCNLGPILQERLWGVWPGCCLPAPWVWLRKGSLDHATWRGPWENQPQHKSMPVILSVCPCACDYGTQILNPSLCSFPTAFWELGHLSPSGNPCKINFVSHKAYISHKMLTDSLSKFGNNPSSHSHLMW